MSALLSYEEHAARVADLIAAGDLEALAHHLNANVNLRTTGSGTRVIGLLRALPRPDTLRLVRALIACDRAIGGWNPYLIGLVNELAVRLPSTLDDDASADLLDFTVRRDRSMPVSVVAALVEWQRGQPGGVSDLLTELVKARAVDSQRMRQLAGELVGPQLRPGDGWAERILADLPGLDPVWHQLVAHAATALSAKPSATWTKIAAGLLAGVDNDKARTVLDGWLAEATHTPTRAPDSVNADILRGLLWLLPLLPAGPETARLLGGITETMLRRLPEVGPACPKLANAAVGVLARIDGEAALAQLARLSARVSYKGTLKELNKALDARAAAMGLSRDEVEELAVPAYGLTGVGVATVEFGPCAAELAVRGTAVAVTWRAASGRTVKSPPASVRGDHAAGLAELKSTVKDVSSMLSAQSERLDRLFLARRTWNLAAWRERYLDHPLVGTLARRLIWLVDGVPCGFAGGALRTVSDDEAADDEVAAPDGATVELWHPIGRPVAEVLAWRDWLERHEIVQPFKQAHREVYLLTPAEESTGGYSNRFAAHIVRQHQFHALATARGWDNKLRLMVDDEYPPARRDLPQWGVRAEYWVEGIGDEYGTDTNEAGTFLRLATDQVRFYPIDAAETSAHAAGGGYGTRRWGGRRAPEPLRLEGIPPLLFSEIMRDVDLFVGVATVGNDPTWFDGGPDGRFRNYWESYSFGELSATAETRRDLLVRLLPRLAIGSRAHVDGRFLVVRGDLHTYKIHLGSGNILMSPNDAYLCIVPERGHGRSTDGLLLPFEGDGVLAVVLSKAMLLARDSQITDPSITRQLGSA